MGRPSSYKPEYDAQVYRLALLGLTDEEIGRFFGVSETTINNWKLEHPGFLESLKEGKANADAKVSEKLYRRAMGYTHEEEKIFLYEGEIVRAETTKHYPPDTTAAIFWLKNRHPDKWRDRKEFTGSDGKDLIPEAKSDIEAVRRIAFAFAKAESLLEKDDAVDK